MQQFRADLILKKKKISNASGRCEVFEFPTMH
jgi:hypothetical protein